MNIIVKYIIYFILGIYIYYLFNYKNLIEGLETDVKGSFLTLYKMMDNIKKIEDENLIYENKNTGCKNYDCTVYNNSENDNWNSKTEGKHFDICINSDKLYTFNLDTDEFGYPCPTPYQGGSASERCTEMSIPCDRNICCENLICGEQGLTDKKCKEEKSEESTLLSYAKCSKSSCKEIDYCCSQNPNESVQELFNSILEFRKKHQKLNEKNQYFKEYENEITGLDIRNFLYFNLLDLERMSGGKDTDYCENDDSFNVNNDCTPLTLTSNQSVDTWPSNSINDKNDIKYNDFNIIAYWLNNLDYTNNGDINKIILSDKILYNNNKGKDGILKTLLVNNNNFNQENNMYFNRGGDSIRQKKLTGINVFDRIIETSKIINDPNTNTTLSKNDIKKLIILLDQKNSVNLTPTDYFFHSYSEQSKMSSIDSTMFGSLL